jgi:uroporphyrin-III C-methyltransferase
LTRRVEEGSLKWLRREFEEDDLTSLGREDVGGIVDAVFVTIGRCELSIRISTLCRRLRIPVNVTDAPDLCTFSLLSTHSDGPLQIGITTSGNGCKLASRIRREIAATLPKGLGDGIARLGRFRRKILEEEVKAEKGLGSASTAVPWEDEISVMEACVNSNNSGLNLPEDNTTRPSSASDIDNDDDTPQPSTFNRLVLPTDHEAAKTRRTRWFSQICEYWPLRRLASLSDADISTMLADYVAQKQLATSASTETITMKDTTLQPRKRGRMLLVGTGPGSPSLLTVAAHHHIRTADLILADKLVPSAILDLIPRRTPVHIARKFPGNADAAQAELLRLGEEGVARGETVVRLKQGDPFVFGRGGEEVEHFERGLSAPALTASDSTSSIPSTSNAAKFPTRNTVTVLPGLTSALTALLCACIPATHRGVSDSIFITTGTGRHGVSPPPPIYNPSQTYIFLMALHRLPSLVASLLGPEKSTDTPDNICKVNGHVHDRTTINTGDNIHQHEAASQSPTPSLAFPLVTPCAVIERASCPDQRVIRTTLRHVVEAVEAAGSRPPGLLVVGWSCEVLRKVGEGQRWCVEEGFEENDVAVCGGSELDFGGGVDGRDGIVGS